MTDTEPAPEEQKPPDTPPPDETPPEAPVAPPIDEETPADQEPETAPENAVQAEGSTEPTIVIEGDPDDPNTRGYVAAADLTVDGEPVNQQGTVSGPAAGPSPDAGFTTHDP